MDRFLGPTLVVATLLFLSPLAVWSLSKDAVKGAIGLLLGLGVIVLFGRFHPTYRAMIRDFRASSRWEKGAHGEMAVGDVLARLPDSYVVFHDYHPMDSQGRPVAWNVDHLVVGPTGVFVIETKNYSQARVEPASKSSFTRKNVKQADGNAIAFKKCLTAWSRGALQDQFVRPLLVYAQTNAYVVQPHEGRVKVIPLKWLEHDIGDQTGNQLDADVVYRIARVLFSQLRWEFREDFRSQYARIEAASRELKMARADQGAAARHDGPAAPTLPTATLDAATPAVCPRCGAPLVRHIATQGARAGKAFLGCSNYRQTTCRYIFELD